MGTIIAISNQKGGVGKTTTCISLGACLAEFGYETLLVDLDSQANLTIALGLEPDEIDWAIPDLFEPSPDEPTPPIQSIIQSSPLKHLDVLPGDMRLASVERALFEMPAYETRLARILAPLAASYDYILIDCPPHLSSLTISALTSANIVLAPVQTEFFAARGLLHLMETVEAVRQHTNPHLAFYLVATLYDRRNNICRHVLNQLQQNFSQQLLQTIIGVDTRLRESAAAGEPINLYDSRSRAAEQHRELAREITSLDRTGK